MFEREEYLIRRKRLRELLSNGLILFLGNEESGINFEHNTYPYRQDSTFIYFFGLQIPGLQAVMDLEEDKEIVFGDNPSIDDIVFTGPLESLEEQAYKIGVTIVNPTNSLENYIGNAIAKGRQIHYLPPYRPEHILKLSELLDLSTPEVPKKVSTNLIKAVVQLRSIKSSAEIVEIERAVNTTVEMQFRAMEMAQVGMTEADLFGAVQNIAMANGNNTSFPSIVTINGQILHNHFRGNLLKAGDLVLCDCGAENYSGYAGDLTRTFPVNNTFSLKQREIYDIVYRSYQRAVGMLKPQELFREVHYAACKEIILGLTEVGLMKGDPDKAVEAGAHTLFFQCGLGHMMGLDVHDMENLGEQYVGYTDEIRQSKEFGFKSLRMGRALEEGMVLTIEPGIYFIPELIALRKSENKYVEYVNYDKLGEYNDFGGIRLEDDFLITQNGSRLLGAKLPTSSLEIENFRTSKTPL
ncbi:MULTISPECIES: aminopeptidase P family protein [unclassified Arenibacter]|uniref:aminopeptidase P family protein n=1 Tax=unclassified Arenibacter TaxID=2615047 RepID=UPI000E342D6B|nr:MULTISPECIES: aminopeptidase P family protein [unclassified Arenibacter]MCM4164717.1 Xaa-Pro aminopeptidase [Arenibacter sp. A80]RFT55791.1 M24 family metallopeptidase [Arenibacter sp. P308M17]